MKRYLGRLGSKHQDSIFVESMKLTLHKNQLEDLDQALEISKTIFKPSPKELQKYHNKNDWLKKINEGGLLISVLNEREMVGFAVCYPKASKFHIWNVGVLKESRKAGIWKKMYKEIIKYAKGKNFKHLTINTYKTKYPRMYSFVLDNDYKEYKTKGDKSFFVKII